MTRAVVRWLDAAWARYQQLPPDQQAQARRLLAALRLSPRSGRFWHQDAAGKPLWFVSAYDTHRVYRVLYVERHETIYILDVFVFPYETDDS